jgi:very-short-patch-repair endonuclease
VYLTSGGDPGELRNRARGALAAAPAGSVVTGVSALGLCGVPLAEGFTRDSSRRIHLLAPPGRRQGPRRPGVAGHVRAAHCAAVTEPRSGIPIAPPTHSWVDAVRWLGRETGWGAWDSEPAATRGLFETPAKRAFLESVQLGDALLRRQTPLCWQEQLDECAQADVGPGSKLVHEASKQVRARTDSFMETWLRLVVWDAGFPDPEVNFEVAGNGWRYLLDLAWPDRMINLEYHGRQHFEKSDQSYKDVPRRARLQDAGWSIHEAVYADLREPAGMLRRLARSFGW